LESKVSFHRCLPFLGVGVGSDDCYCPHQSDCPQCFHL
jgi:hypothetical protein